MNIDQQLASCQSEKCRAFLVFWHSKCIGDSIPLRSSIDPLDMINFLPNLFLSQRLTEDGKTRYFYRLIGTGIVNAFHFDATNKYLDQCFKAEPQQAVHREYDRVLSTACPVVSIAQQPNASREFLKFEKVTSPLIDKDGEASIILGFIDILSQGNKAFW